MDKVLISDMIRVSKITSLMSFSCTILMMYKYYVIDCVTEKWLCVLVRESIYSPICYKIEEISAPKCCRRLLFFEVTYFVLHKGKQCFNRYISPQALICFMFFDNSYGYRTFFHACIIVPDITDTIRLYMTFIRNSQTFRFRSY